MDPPGLSGSGFTTQKIKLTGSDDSNSHAVYGRDVLVEPSSQENSFSSNKVILV